MVDKKTSAETLRSVLDNTEEFRGAVGGDNFRTLPSAIAHTRSSEEITSGASPVECDPNVDITYVTSGGTAGDEHVVLPIFDDWVNGQKNKRVHVVALKVQTNISDVVLVFANGDNSATNIIDAAGIRIASITEGVVLDGLAASASFEFLDGSWYFTRGGSGGNDDSVLTNQVAYVPVPDPNPATAQVYLGADTGDTSFSQKTVGTRSSEDITSGASPVNCDPNVDITYVTSGGTAGDEHVVLPSFNPEFSPQNNGRVHVASVKVRTDDGDVVKVFAGGDNFDIEIHDEAGTSISKIVGGVILNAVDSSATFVWSDNNWYLTRKNQNDASELTDQVSYVPALDPNPATESAFLGVAVDDTSATFKPGSLVPDGDVTLIGTSIVTSGVVSSAINIVDFAATFGAIDALTGTIETVTIPGLLTTDHVTVSCIDSPPSGMIIANARVSAADTLEIYIVTAVALGITLGSLNFRCLVHR